MKFRGFLTSWATAEASRPRAVERSAKCRRSSSFRFSRRRATIWLKVWERLATSPPPKAGTWTERSPPATRWAASVSSCSGREKDQER